jgi:26S proteasome regulatory subunit N12
MDPKLTEVNQMFARFKVAYARNDLNACETLLSQLKVRARRLCWISPFPFHT